MLSSSKADGVLYKTFAENRRGVRKDAGAKGGDEWGFREHGGREDDHRPMPQVPAVRKVADAHHGLGAEPLVSDACGGRHAACDDQHSAECGQERGEAREDGGVVVEDAGDENHEEADGDPP